MKTRYAVALGVVASFGLGALAGQQLHAQAKAKPPIYLIEEIDITNSDGFAKEFLPLMLAANKAAGVRSIAAGANLTAIEGEPPKSRVAIQVWDSVEAIKTYRSSPAYIDARKVADKYAKYRTYALEGLAQ